MQIVSATDIEEFPRTARGKVRDVYDLGDDRALIVATDRISAFDVVMNEPIPYRGVILNKMTIYWMDRFKAHVANHLLADDVADFPEALKPYADMLEGRAVVARKADPLPIECIVRGYIAGSGWKDYLAGGSVCGHKLPEGLLESQRLDEPLFTPSTKAEQGAHDVNISRAQAVELIGETILAKAERLSLDLYCAARDEALTKGIIIADTKFEFGLADGELILIDEALTPDSSRFWPLEGYEPAASQPSFDKQFLRDWLTKQDWDKTSPPPTLPDDVIEATKAKYIEAYRNLTGDDPFGLEDWRTPGS